MQLSSKLIHVFLYMSVCTAHFEVMLLQVINDTPLELGIIIKDHNQTVVDCVSIKPQKRELYSNYQLLGPMQPYVLITVCSRKDSNALFTIKDELIVAQSLKTNYDDFYLKELYRIAHIYTIPVQPRHITCSTLTNIGLVHQHLHKAVGVPTYCALLIQKSKSVVYTAHKLECEYVT